VPYHLRVDASTACQLRCPGCPTTEGKVREGLATGLLSAAALQRLLDENPQVGSLELSNWGEIFLNPELPDLLRIAWKRRVDITAANGVNLNSASPEALKAVVAYRVRALTCSIDGATPEVYQQYRRRGHLPRVLENIRQIQSWKRRYWSSFPRLTWQFVVFEHNHHELEQARQKARELGMAFVAKTSWGGLHGTQPPQAANRGGDSERRRIERSACAQLWQAPQINHDGRLLGCCINHWGDFGNVFERPLEALLEAAPMQAARRMLMGQTPPQEGVPCSQCSLYHQLCSSGDWIRPEECGTSPWLAGMLRVRRCLPAWAWEVLRELRARLG
jgi:MoaA/NifB/PqqE/SkfB family radical SAM enzyme